MKTVAVDFDGVIHEYSEGWKDGSIYDPPVTGALESLRLLMQDYAVFIFTTRPARQVASWLAERGFEVVIDVGTDSSFWNQKGVLLVTNRKLAAVAYIDDRAIQFINWPLTLLILERMKDNKS